MSGTDLKIEPMIHDGKPFGFSRVIWNGVDVGYVFDDSKHVPIYQRGLDAFDRSDIIAAINKQLGGGYYESTSVGTAESSEIARSNDEPDEG